MNKALSINFDEIYRAESRRVLATLIRVLGDFDRAEEALHEAFRAALEQWPLEGVPANPRAWLVSAGRFKAIDAIRRDARFNALDAIDEGAAENIAAPDDPDGEDIEDDRLRLIFTCCHPALQPDAQVALTLREVCGLTTEEIASAFLTPAPTLAQRIVRAKAKIRDAKIPYETPAPEELPERLDSVLRVIYLVFNEGYAASSGATLTRHDLSGEAIRLARLLLELLPQPEAEPESEHEAMGLLALMLLHESRRVARTSPSGDVILIVQQNHIARRRRARNTPRFVQQHQREQADDFRFRQRFNQQARKTYRFSRQIVPGERSARRSRVAFVEYQVNHAQNTAQAIG